MAKKKPIQSKVNPKITAENQVKTEVVYPSLLPFNNFRVQSIILLLLGFLLYMNTFNHSFALDDGIVIIKNEYVQQGFKGIPKIMKTDAYESFYKQSGASNQLSGGRYRPLSLVTFAIEHSVFGESWPIRHVINVLFYLLSVVLLLYFLRKYLFAEKPDIAFLITLLFLVHPIHTEVVANVKSRDEILCVLFIVLTTIFHFRYAEKSKLFDLLLSVICFFLALLSKEYAITLVTILPLTIYLRRESSLVSAIKKSIPLFVVALVYLIIRYKIVGANKVVSQGVLNDPFFFATGSERWATKIFILLLYLKVLIFPHPLSSDYQYNHIPYRDFNDIGVWFSILLYVSFILLAIRLVQKRNILSLGLGIYLVNLLLVSNLLVDIGATMGERLMYFPSLGFLLCVVVLLYSWFEKNAAGKYMLYAFTICVLFFASAKTIARNAEWKNDYTVIIADVKVVPNSAAANERAGGRSIDESETPENKGTEREKKLLNDAVNYCNKALEIYPNFVNAYVNGSVAFYKLGDFDSSKNYLDKAKALFPRNPHLERVYKAISIGYMSQAIEFQKKNELQPATELLLKAIATDSLNVDAWYNLGGAYYMSKNFTQAKACWERTLKYYPTYADAQKGLAALRQMGI